MATGLGPSAWWACNPNSFARSRLSLVPEASSWLHKNALQSFLEETCKERLAEVQRIVEHVELSLTELLQRAKEINDKEADDEVQKPFPK